MSKAFGAGADFVMLGGMFAGHDQCGGDIVEREGKKYKLFYGMSSSTAMKKYQGGVKDYRYSYLVQVLSGHSVDCLLPPSLRQGIRGEECGAKIPWRC